MKNATLICDIHLIHLSKKVSESKHSQTASSDAPSFCGHADVPLDTITQLFYPNMAIKVTTLALHKSTNVDPQMSLGLHKCGSTNVDMGPQMWTCGSTNVDLWIHKCGP